MGRGTLWQGIVEWWKPTRSGDSPGDANRAALSSPASEPSYSSYSSGRSPSLTPSKPTLTGTEASAVSETSTGAGWVSVAPEAPVLREVILDPEGGEDSFLFDGDATEEELLEFMSADYEAVPADPEFKESLREQLWEWVSKEEGTAGR